MTDDSKGTILNVDDNEAGRYAVTRVLQKAGYEVLEAASAREVLQILEQQGQKVDLILLDINLPDASGLELCSRLKADPRFTTTPIVHLTATYVMSMGHLADSCADGYLMQPVEPAALVANIRALIRARDSELRLRKALDAWHAALDSVDVPMAVLDDRAELLHWNRAFADVENGRALRADPLARLVKKATSSGQPAAETVMLEPGAFEVRAYPVQDPADTSARTVLMLLPAKNGC